MINSICKFNLFMGPSEHNFRFREIVFQPFWKITSNKQLQLTKPEWWLKFFLRKFQTLIIIVTTNVTVCALRNGVWYSSFLCSFPNYFCMMAQTSVTSFVGFLNISGTRVIYNRVWKRKNYFAVNTTQFLGIIISRFQIYGQSNEFDWKKSNKWQTANATTLNPAAASL